VEKSLRAGLASSKEFDRLEKKNLLSCICGVSKKISKQIMAPQVVSSKNETNDNQQKKIYQNVQKKLTELRKYVEKNAEYVGDNFASEVRSIHYDKKNVRNIYGKTSLEEHKELIEEGIEINSIPWVDKTDS
jgi:hypothetical protein